jgi:hypothetical protein
MVITDVYKKKTNLRVAQHVRKTVDYEVEISSKKNVLLILSSPYICGLLETFH